MPTFKEVLTATRVTFKDKTSGKRLHEIEQILRKHQAFEGLTPQKATAILEDLGPTFVKVGQLASNRSDLIPQAYADAFKQLRAQVSPVPFDDIVAIIEHSLGHPWQETFAHIEREPLGSASIAQVHRAWLVGGPGASGQETVAVKVRRPGVVQQMAEDLTLLRHVLALANLVPAADDVMPTITQVVDELERTTADELDFCVECANLECFRAELAGQQTATCPRVYPEYGTDEILVMEYIEGVSIADCAGLRAAGDDAAKLGAQLADNYVMQIMEAGFFHADPHPGNILVREHQLVWLDLGMTGTLSQSERTQVGQLFSAVVRNDAFALKESLLVLAKPQGPVDHSLLLTQISSLLASYASVSLAEIKVGEAMLEVIEVVRSQNLALPASLTLLARGVVTLEGVLSTIAPHTSVIQSISRQVYRQMFSYQQLAAQAQEFLGSAASSAQAAAKLPAQVSHTLEMVEKGQIKVGARLEMPSDFLATLYSISGTVSLALISAGLFVGSSLIAQTSMEPRLLEIPLLGFLGYVGALVLGMYVVWHTLRHRHRHRHSRRQQ